MRRSRSHSWRKPWSNSNSRVYRLWFRIESVTAGSVDIGDSSRALTDDEKANGVEENIVAIDGIAVITDKDNSVTELTSDDLKKIYTGEISNWKDLGGKDEAIVAIGREAASGTRGAFEELLDVRSVQICTGA